MQTKHRAEMDPIFEELLKLLGVLNYSWTNTESLLIHLIAGLARVDKETAAIIFLTLNTTRARIDLVNRLSKLSRVTKPCRSEILAVTAEMLVILKTRNRYNHCIYSFDAEGKNAKTILMKIFEKKDQLKYGQENAIDQKEIDVLNRCLESIESVNRRIWNIVQEYKFPT